MVIRVKAQTFSRSEKIVCTTDCPGGFPRLVQRRQKHPRENRDDRNHDEELYEGKNFHFYP